MKLIHLKAKINEKDDTGRVESNERLKFNEGCFWMSIRYYKILYNISFF